jgi:mannan endo-1,4-beta-mannosidase
MRSLSARRMVLAVAAALAFALLVAGCSLVPGRGASTPSGPTLAGVVKPPAAGALLGIYRPPAPFDPSPLDSYATISPKRPAIVMWYQQWGNGEPNLFDPGMVAAVYARGAIPMISWEPWDPGAKPHNLRNPADAPDWSLATIIGGQHDDYLRTWAAAAKALGGPVMLRPMHEMNGDWYPWGGTVNGNTPSQYVEAWRHVHDVFVQVGATNVTWVWSVNVNSKPNTAENAYNVYYPGDAYVDWVAVSGFNAGTNRATGKRNTFEELFTKPLAYLKTIGKPIIIGESGSVQANADKAAWITDTYQQLQTTHPEVRGFVYYDALETGVKYGVQDFRITTTPASTAAYRNAISPSYFVSAPEQTLAAWEAKLSAADRQRLASYKPIY